MDINLTEVIKEHIEKGGPSYKLGKETLLEMCNKLGINTISDFWDVLIKSQRLYCTMNFWEHEYSPCMDSEGRYVAYGRDEIAKALGKGEKDVTCHDICEVCGSCAHINQIDARLFYYLADLMDDKKLTLDDEPQNT